MIKGTQRQMVMVRTSESESFEMAYFVVRSGVGAEKSEKSMIDEANSIVSSVIGGSSAAKREKRKRAFRRILVFSVGAIFGAVALGITLALFFIV